MKASIRGITLGTDGARQAYCMQEISLEVLSKTCTGMAVLLGIDGSSTCTGISVFNLGNSGLLGTIALKRSSKEDAVHYKVELKRFLVELLGAVDAREAVYEEPFFGVNALTNKVLFMLRSSVEEVIAENEPRFNQLNFHEISNARWKKLFLEKVPKGGKEVQKAAIREKVLALYPFMCVCTQDECDATGIGYAACRADSIKGLENQRKPRPFQYCIEFFGGDSDEEFTEWFDGNWERLSVPEALVCGGYWIVPIKGTGSFENYIYREMGDEDNLLVLRFSSQHHANVVMQYRIADLTVRNKFIYAVVWRKHRKKA